MQSSNAFFFFYHFFWFPLSDKIHCQNENTFGNPREYPTEEITAHLHGGDKKISEQRTDKRAEHSGREQMHRRFGSAEKPVEKIVLNKLCLQKKEI